MGGALVVDDFIATPYLDRAGVATAAFVMRVCADVGSVATDPATGDIRIVRTLPVPGVHFIEIDQPLS